MLKSCDNGFEVLEVSRDWLRGLGLAFKAEMVDTCRYWLVGVEYVPAGNMLFSGFGERFFPLFGSLSLDDVINRLVALRYEDEELGFDYAFEIWHIVETTPDWQLACCEWCELVDEVRTEALFHVHVANSGHDFVPAFVIGHDLFLPEHGLETPYDYSWRCRSVYNDRRGRLIDWRCCDWLSPDVCDSIAELVSAHPAYLRCGEVEDSIWSDFDDLMEDLATSAY